MPSAGSTPRRRKIGIAAILVHALNDRAKHFYLSCGFVESVIDELILFARLKDVEAVLGQ